MKKIINRISKNILKCFLYFISSVAILTVGLVVYLVWFQPSFNFPRPTGQYNVGISTYHWIDTKRKETLHKDPTHPNRELMVNIWYPAQGKLDKKPTTPYVPYLVNHLKKNQKLVWLLGFSRPIYTYAKPDSIMATDMPQFPVIVFSHSLGACNYDSNTAQCEELASNGYVVVGINHTYSSRLTQFPDGRTIDGMEAIKHRRTGSNFTQMKKLFDQELEVWIDDTQFVLDQLEQLARNKKSIFYQRLDQKNIGMFGHSFGGATAIQVCRRDSRVKTGVDLDGALFGPDAAKPFGKPLMFMLNKNVIEMVKNKNHLPQKVCNAADFKISSLAEEKAFKSILFFSIVQLAQSLGHDVYTFCIKDFEHLDFTDIAFLKFTFPLSKLLIKLGIVTGSIELGSIDGFKATEIVNAYLVNFFNKYLKGQPSTLLDGTNKQYAEVETKQWVN